MAIQQKIPTFNPKQNERAKLLLSMSGEDVVKRYLKKNHANQPNFHSALVSAVNSCDEQGYLINYNLYGLEGPNLNLIGRRLLRYASKANQLGYQFRVDVIANDIEWLFREVEDEILKVEITTPVQPYVSEVMDFFVSEIMDKKVFPTIEKLHKSGYVL